MEQSLDTLTILVVGSKKGLLFACYWRPKVCVCIYSVVLDSSIIFAVSKRVFKILYLWFPKEFWTSHTLEGNERISINTRKCSPYHVPLLLPTLSRLLFHRLALFGLALFGLPRGLLLLMHAAHFASGLPPDSLLIRLATLITNQ